MAAVIVPETCVPFFNSMVTVSFTSMHASTPILIQIDFLFIYIFDKYPNIERAGHIKLRAIISHVIIYSISVSSHFAQKPATRSLRGEKKGSVLLSFIAPGFYPHLPALWAPKRLRGERKRSISAPKGI